MSCLLRSTQGWDLKGFLLWERDKLRKGGPHATEGVRCTLARFSSVMYGIVLGVTPPDTLRKMNSDNNVCSTLTPNIMNEHDYVWLRYDYDMLLDMYRFMQIEKAMKCIDDDLKFPWSSGLGSCHE